MELSGGLLIKLANSSVPMPFCAVPMRLFFLALVMMVNLLKADSFVIAHRGSSGERPEHTLAAYRLALEQAADYIVSEHPKCTTNVRNRVGSKCTT
jgi:glycerophosphoryl diester phosphodiesterase